MGWSSFDHPSTILRLPISSISPPACASVYMIFCGYRNGNVPIFGCCITILAAWISAVHNIFLAQFTVRQGQAQARKNGVVTFGIFFGGNYDENKMNDLYGRGSWAAVGRRVIDRMLGYIISPVVWKHVKGKDVSAGCVQTVALRLLVEGVVGEEVDHPRIRPGIRPVTNIEYSII